jgi:hypothetical protein
MKPMCGPKTRRAGTIRDTSYPLNVLQAKRLKMCMRSIQPLTRDYLRKQFPRRPMHIVRDQYVSTPEITTIGIQTLSRICKATKRGGTSRPHPAQRTPPSRATSVLHTGVFQTTTRSL